MTTSHSSPDRGSAATATTPLAKTPLHSPLHAAHEALDAKFGPFGDWEMPLEYAGGGVVAEHTAVRESVGVFDVSHLGKTLIAGPGAAEFANSQFTNDLRRIGPGQAQYTMYCTADGGVVDDLIGYLVSEDEVFCVPNAANNAEIAARLAEAAPEGITVTNQHTDYGVLAVQGPRSADVLADLGLPAELDYMAFADADWRGTQVRICRTGYTGEHGYELLPKRADATTLWDALLASAQSLGGRAAGLGARDTLRTEMGYPLHGHELSLEISPVQAGAGWAVGWKKDAFSGHDALVAERTAGPTRRLRGLRAIDRGIPRAGMPVLDAEGNRIGETTSGTFSPTLKIGIALALIEASAGVELGNELVVDVRGRPLRCEVVKPPFVEPHTR